MAIDADLVCIECGHDGLKHVFNDPGTLYEPGHGAYLTCESCGAIWDASDLPGEYYKYWYTGK